MFFVRISQTTPTLRSNQAHTVASSDPGTSDNPDSQVRDGDAAGTTTSARRSRDDAGARHGDATF